MTRLIGVLTLAAAATMFGCTNQGGMNQNGQDQMDTGMHNTVAPNDQQFVSTAGAAGMYEVEAGRVASSKGSTSAVRSIGQRMVTDHTKANDQLMTLSKRKGMTAPTEMTSDQNDMVSKLRGMSGADFDKEYLKQQEAAHHEAIALFTTESKSGRDADLRAFAKDTLPTLQEHLRMIMQGMGSDMK